MLRLIILKNILSTIRSFNFFLWDISSICGFCICEFMYSLKFICDPIIHSCCTFKAFGGHVQRKEWSELPEVHVRSQGEWDDAHGLLVPALRPYIKEYPLHNLFASQFLPLFAFCLWFYSVFFNFYRNLFLIYLLIMLLQLSHFCPFTQLHPAHPLPPTFPPYSSCPWVILISSSASTLPTLFLPSPCLFYTYHLCYLFSVPFPPLPPSQSPIDNPPCDLHFCGSVSVLVVCLVCSRFCFMCGR